MFEDKLEIAKKVAEELKLIPGIVTAHVDDYSKVNSDFQLVAVLELDDSKKPVNRNFSMRKIRAGIEKVLKNNERFISKFGRGIDTPVREYDKYSYRNFNESYFKGYEKDYIMIDFIVVLPEEQISVTELLSRKTDKN